ncbi:MAG: hypothetical protein IJ794_03390 [Lachnospiraceae bacterium]|nr:hypothetical protein [Lachnospiraceae bacterium]
MSNQSVSKQSEKEVKELETLAAISELAVSNKIAITAHTIIASIIAAAYMLEAVKGTRTVGYAIATVIICVLPYAVGWVFYSKDHETSVVKHTIGTGYALTYCFLLFTAQNDLVFTYVIPMMIIVTLYNELKYTVKIGTGVIIVNFADVIRKVVGPGEVNSATLEIQALLSVLIVAYFLWVSTANSKFADVKLARLQLEEVKENALFTRILQISGNMSGNVANVTEEMRNLKDSVDQTLTSMNEVTTGSAESAEAIQQQMMKTNEIQGHIDEVTLAAEVINNNVKTTANAVKEGQRHVEDMNKLTKQVDAAGKDVAAALQTFQDTTAKMNSITDLITNVADQTSLLSLNASIEAARAGEAGRGFGVVASEISNLAGQTTAATEDITKLIGTIADQVNTMVDTINNLLETGVKESKVAADTARNFTVIAENMREISQHSSQLSGTVENLATANMVIVESIQTISAITEEVSAHAGETYSISEQNQMIVDNVKRIVDELNADAQRLQENA